MKNDFKAKKILAFNLRNLLCTTVVCIEIMYGLMTVCLCVWIDVRTHIHTHIYRCNLLSAMGLLSLSLLVFLHVYLSSRLMSNLQKNNET